MTDSRSVDKPQTYIKPNEVEILNLLETTAKQYEESMKIADFSDSLESSKELKVRYSWDTPIGLVLIG